MKAHFAFVQGFKSFVRKFIKNFAEHFILLCIKNILKCEKKLVLLKERADVANICSKIEKMYENI